MVLEHDDVVFVRRRDGGHYVVKNNQKLADAIGAVIDGRAIVVDRECAEKSVLYSEPTLYSELSATSNEQ